MCLVLDAVFLRFLWVELGFQLTLLCYYLFYAKHHETQQLMVIWSKHNGHQGATELECHEQCCAILDIGYKTSSLECEFDLVSRLTGFLSGKGSVFGREREVGGGWWMDST